MSKFLDTAADDVDNAAHDEDNDDAKAIAILRVFSENSRTEKPNTCKFHRV